ncbi:3-deoxy-manno-octulosonate cytidylyltransferase [Taklimakanibacter albus]|uniref:3-deoxy-manno-octulosonate cytidylyltransferase n=1 Tax=Taklimakanibacter albus TaxID=2800327 RepID=A0ACC5RDW6_9HYPH|nr:3-deoxy-manno-octulosonate cytidylyltransferase [Aestuariivirga sp. YIM B02566]MBK1870896.1 3-deoxy-manno-octulosonate cytidylyltransferase [Aestuariivirga sp. YIM B02566]
MIEHQNTIVIIPARMASTRLPGKPLADIHGVPMIVHVWKRAIEANVGQVLVACAEMEIARAIKAHGGDAIVTEPSLASGSDRILAALALRDPERRYRFIVNLQGDLPTVTPLDVQRCLGGLVNETIDISTIAAPITEEADVANPNIVKAIAPLTDEREVAFARDFQRLPGPEFGPRYWHHIGIYAYRRESLERFVKLPQSAREIERRLEQMRALDNGMSIAVVRVDSVPLGVDTPADLEAARQMLKAGRF